MKNIVVYIIIMSLFCSCQNNIAEHPNGDDPDMPVGGTIFDFNINFVIVDEDLQDCLKPESPAYFGEEYIQGIKLLDAQKKEFDPYEYYNSVRSEQEEELTLIQPPYRWFPGNQYSEPMYIYEGTLGYYFIRYGISSTIPNIDGTIVLSYIHYPDGNEDEIKIQISYKTGSVGTVTGSVHTFDRIWINSELAFVRGVWDVEDFYYNPKYFKWLEPELDDNGKQIGNAVRPKHAFNLVLTK